jgi:hypothetical protein
MREPTADQRETPAPAIREARIAGRFWRDWARNLGIGAAAGVFLAIIGAAGTGEAPLGERLLYWTPLMTLGVPVGGGVAMLMMRLLPARANVWLLGALTTLGIAAISGGFILWYTSLFWNTDVNAAALPGFLAALLAISAGMTAIMIAANRPGAVTHAPSQGAPQPVRFLERLPAKLKGAALYAVSAEDHYLRLHTSKGSDLILMRLGDAIAELDGLEGAQTHRSWWVARDAVESTRRDGERVTLVLKGGAEAPVSRPNVRALREAGWL